MSKRNRVVVTGMGILAPNGIGLEAFWESLVAGRSGVGPITHFDASAFKSRIAGEVKGFEPLDYIDPKFKPKRMARHTQFAFAAMKMALADANFDPALHPVDHPIPVMLGVSTTAMDILEGGWGDLPRRGPARGERRRGGLPAAGRDPNANHGAWDIGAGHHDFFRLPVRFGCDRFRGRNDSPR